MRLFLAAVVLTFGTQSFAQSLQERSEKAMVYCAMESDLIGMPLTGDGVDVQDPDVAIVTRNTAEGIFVKNSNLLIFIPNDGTELLAGEAALEMISNAILADLNSSFGPNVIDRVRQENPGMFEMLGQLCGGITPELDSWLFPN